MSLTKIGSIGINTGIQFAGVTTISTLNSSSNVLSVGGTVNFVSDVSIGGTLTYEDVTNVDAVGLITARDGIKVGSGITLSVDGDGFFTGVITATSYSGIDLSDVTGATGDFSIADKIVHTGDTDTAIRFPAADTITAETGGSERVRISANGRVAVGNATNNANDNALFKAVADDGEAADLYVGQFINLEATAGQSYGVNIQAGSNSTDHGFRVMNRANDTTQFIVRGDGNVGVNTDFTGSQTWRSGKTLEIFGGGGNVTGELHLGANRSDANQSVGSINFFDNGQDTSHKQIALIEADKAGSTSNKRGGDLIFYTKPDNVASPTERLLIKSDGNVEIGGGTHSRRLAVHDTTNSVILIEGASNGTSNLMFGDENDEDVGMLGYNHGSNYLAFTVNATETLRITSDGDIYTSNGQVRDSARLTITKGHVGVSTALFLHNSNGSGTAAKISSSKGLVLGADVYDNSNASESFISFETDNNERFRITSNGDWKAASFDNTYACMYRALSNASTSNMMNSSGTMIFSSATFSMGNSNVYNTSNGKYTAPIRGLYLFNFNGLLDDSYTSGSIAVRAKVDGSITDIFYVYESPTTGYYHHLSGSHVIALNAGQTHEFHATAAGFHISNETNFSACLIQAY